MKRQTRAEQNFNSKIFWFVGALVMMVLIFLTVTYSTDAQTSSSCDDFQVGDLVFVPGDQVNMFGVVVEKSEEIGACAWVKIGEHVYPFDTGHLLHAEVMRLNEDSFLVFAKDAVQDYIIVDDASLCDEECQTAPTICEIVEQGYQSFLNVTSVTILDVESEQDEWSPSTSYYGNMVGYEVGLFVGFPNNNYRNDQYGRANTEELCGDYSIPHHTFFEERRPCPTFPGEYTTTNGDVVTVRGGYLNQDGVCVVRLDDNRELLPTEFVIDPTQMPEDFMGPCEAIGAFLEESGFEDPYVSFPSFSGFEVVDSIMGKVTLGRYIQGETTFAGPTYGTLNGHSILISDGPNSLSMNAPFGQFCP